MKLPRTVFLIGGLVAVVLVIVAVGALLLPWLIDSQLIKDRITAEFANKTAASVTFGKIAFQWFPQPTVLIENARVSFSDKIKGAIQTTKIYPSIFHLLTGRLVLRGALLQEPKITVRLPESSAKPFDLEALENQIRSALVYLTSALPGPRIDLSDGSADIRIGDHASVILENVVAQTVGSSAGLGFELRARSNLSERFKIEGKISAQSLASELDIGVQRLKIKESLTLLPLQVADHLQQGEASFEVKIASVGLRKLKASIDGSVGPFVLARHGRTATVEAKRLKGGMTYEAGSLQVDVEQLDLGAPRLKASGTLKIDSVSSSGRINVRDVDIAELGDLALRIADDSEGVKRVFQYLRSGAITEMNFQSAGRSVAEMGLSKNILVSGLMRNCKIFIPGPDLELANVTGSVRIADNILEANDIAANLGTTKGWNGKLRVGLEGKAAPFHLDMMVNTGASELQSVLLKLVHDETFREELLKARNVEGELSGRLILGETLDAIAPVVAVSKADMRATYAPIPFPIAIRGARLNYDQRIVRLETAQGAVGRSSFAGLGVTLHHDGSRRIKVDSRRVSLDLQQTNTLLRGFEVLQPHLAKLKSARGQIEMENLTLTGAYDDPAGWTFAGAGRFDQAEISHADFPGPVSLSRGRFSANQEKIIFSDIATGISDATWIGGGTFEYRKGEPFQFDTSGMGTIGAQMSQWFSRYVELPEELKVRSPVAIAAGHLVWRAGGDSSFRGQVTVADGPRLLLDAVKHPQGFALKNLTIDDGERRARMTFELARDNLDMSFSGELAQQTIDKIFVSFPMKDSSLRGDIKVNVALADPISFSARGQLSGSNLLIPLADKVLIEKFSVEAGGESLVIQSADLRWDKSHLTVSGTVTGAKEILRVDLDVTGDQLDWGQFQRSFGAEDKRRQQKMGGVVSIPGVEGTIRFKTDRFTFERFNLSALETTAAISRSGIRAEINRGVFCGVNTTGRVDVTDKDIRLDLQLAATDAQLEPTTICLTNQQTDMKGTYSLTARISGRGDREHLRSALKGNFQFTAQNGEFIRAPGIDATFDYLNSTGDFKVAFPDLDRETFPYRFVGVKGRFEGNMLIGDEITVESSLLNLSGQGKVDLERKLVDGKGLIAVLKPVDQVIARIPVISSVLGGTLIGIPVRVAGSLERPEVTYLSPADVGTELLSLPVRILGIPLQAIRLFAPKDENRDNNITK